MKLEIRGRISKAQKGPGAWKLSLSLAGKRKSVTERNNRRYFSSKRNGIYLVRITLRKRTSPWAVVSGSYRLFLFDKSVPCTRLAAGAETSPVLYCRGFICNAGGAGNKRALMARNATPQRLSNCLHLPPDVNSTAKGYFPGWTTVLSPEQT